MFLKISQNSQESTFARVSFLTKLQFKKETLAQLFSCEFCEISRNTFFYRTPPVPTYVQNQVNGMINLKTVFTFIWFNWREKDIRESKRDRDSPGNKTSWRRRNDVSQYVPATSQLRLKWDVTSTFSNEHPTTSRWNVVKMSQWYASTTSYWNLVTTSQEGVTTTSHQFVFTMSQASLKWNTQRLLAATSPRRLSGTYPRRLL